MSPKAEPKTVIPSGSLTEHIAMSHAKTENSALVPADAQAHYEKRGWKVDNSKLAELVGETPTEGLTSDETPTGSAGSSSPSPAGG